MDVTCLSMKCRKANVNSSISNFNKIKTNTRRASHAVHFCSKESVTGSAAEITAALSVHLYRRILRNHTFNTQSSRIFLANKCVKEVVLSLN